MRELFYIGDNFYKESGTAMSSIYEVGTGRRSDFGSVLLTLARGEEVHIRQATQEEMIAARKRLAEIKRK